MKLCIVAASLALVASPGLARQGSQASKPTVEGYLCTFAGQCGGSVVPAPTRDAPETKGFRLARPGGSADVVPTRSRAEAPIRRAAGVASSRGRAERRRSTGAAAPQAVAYADRGAVTPGAGRRADLMIGFELNSDRLTAVGRDAAKVFAQSLLMPQLRDKRFLIEGHTDERGGRAINGPLSARRAQRVAEFLIQNGVDPSRLHTKGLGSSAPLPGHRATDPANRRVEAELLS